MQVSLPRWVIDLFLWLPQNYRAIFPYLLEIYLQLMVLKRLLKVICFRRRFPANSVFYYYFYKERKICKQDSKEQLVIVLTIFKIRMECSFLNRIFKQNLCNAQMKISFSGLIFAQYKSINIIITMVKNSCKTFMEICFSKLYVNQNRYYVYNVCHNRKLFLNRKSGMWSRYLQNYQPTQLSIGI